MEVTHTTFGTVSRDENETRVSGTQKDFCGWANQPNNSWPCSALKMLDTLTATFDSGGDLVGLRGGESSELMADELNAWTSEVLIRAGYPNHPAIRTP